MEEHRLKPMVEGYDPKVFERIYLNTENFRKKLAKQIDARRFGVDYSEILSWFDVKFIFAFNKYYPKFSEEILKGHIISALTMFKYRIMRSAYTNKFSQNIIHVEDTNTLSDLVPDYEIIDEPHYSVNTRDEVLNFMQKNLSSNAYELLTLQLYPPPYILRELQELGFTNTNKIPNSIISDYLELGNSLEAEEYIKALKKEIKTITSLAKEYFSHHKLN